MSNEEGVKITVEEVEKVQILIEKCILKYMKRKEVIDLLYQQHNIDPCFTNIIWKNLEDQNKDFFGNYRLRLALIDTITRFNNLLDKQASLMNQLNRNEVVACRPIQSVPSDLPPNGFNGYSDCPCATLMAQNTNGGTIVQRTNGTRIQMKNESASVSSSSNMDSNPHQSERTSTDDLNSYMSQHLEYTSFHSNGNTVQNQGENNGVTNTSSNLNIQNSAGFIEMPQTPDIFSRQLENGSLH